MSTELSAFQDVLCCPACWHQDLRLDAEGRAGCAACQASFRSIDGILFLVEPGFLDGAQSADRVVAVDEASAEDVRQANTVYHNRFAADYEHDASTQDTVVPGGNCQRRIRDTLELASERSSGGLLLDVCCGTGNVLAQARGLFDRCLGIDVSSGMMQLARERGHAVMGADATRIPLVDESVDCVTGFSALHHLYDYAAAASEMARVLKPGGTFYTDWDPNGRVPRTGWAVRLAVGAMMQWRRWHSTARIPESPLQRVAEFHHNRGAGFLGQRVAEVLRESGFRKAAVLPHVNPPSLTQRRRRGLYAWGMTGLKAASLIWPSWPNVCPWVAVLAQK